MSKPLFTKRHYEEIAAALKRRFVPSNVLNETALEFARTFLEDNPRFNAEVFFKACGMTDDAISLYKDYIIRIG